MISIRLNDDTVSAALERLALQMADMTPAMAEIGELLTESSKLRIDQGVSPDGTPFAPRAASTLDRYAKLAAKGGAAAAGGPLNFSGVLKNTLFHQAGPQQTEVGSNVIQAAVMQFGAEQGQFGAFIGRDSLGRDHFHTIPWGDIPARPFLGVSDEDRTGILEILEEWLLAMAP